MAVRQPTGVVFWLKFADKVRLSGLYLDIMVKV